LFSLFAGVKRYDLYLRATNTIIFTGSKKTTHPFENIKKLIMKEENRVVHYYSSLEFGSVHQESDSNSDTIFSA